MGMEIILSLPLEAYLDAFLRYRERLGAGWIWDNCLELGLGWDRVQSRNLLNLINFSILGVIIFLPVISRER